MFLSITISILFFANGVLAGECRDYNICKKLAPTLANHANITCDMITKKWQDTFDCLAKPGACVDVSGAGVLSGICQGYMGCNYYNKKLNCQNITDERTNTICGITNHADFNVSYNRDLDSKCLDPYTTPYPDSCNETKYQEYQACMVNAALNNFTKGVLQGSCENFRLVNTTEKCSFSHDTCKVVSFTTGTATTIAPLTTKTRGTPIATTGRNVTSTTAESRKGQGTSVNGSLVVLVTTVSVAYCLS